MLRKWPPTECLLYYQTLTEEIRELTNTGVQLGGKHYDTKVSLFPADQKFHAHLAGELSKAHQGGKQLSLLQNSTPDRNSHLWSVNM